MKSNIYGNSGKKEGKKNKETNGKTTKLVFSMTKIEITRPGKSKN